MKDDSKMSDVEVEGDLGARFVACVGNDPTVLSLVAIWSGSAEKGTQNAELWRVVAREGRISVERRTGLDAMLNEQWRTVPASIIGSRIGAQIMASLFMEDPS